MHLLIEAEQARLPAVCGRYGVRRLEIFGSAARQDFDPHASDLDFLVEFDDSPKGHSFDAYGAFKEELASTFRRSVDLTEPGAVQNPCFRAAIERDRQLVYAA